MRIWRWLILVASLSGLGGCGAIYIANQLNAQAGLSAEDIHALDTGDLSGLHQRLDSVPMSALSLRQLALLCDIELKSSTLERAGECLDALDTRASLGGPDSQQVKNALPGLGATLDLALGFPERAREDMATATTPGGQYIFALASIRARDASVARPIADAMATSFDPAKTYYAASLYTALADFPAARAVLEEPHHRLMADYGVAGHETAFGTTVGAAVFRLDPFDTFDYGITGQAVLAPAANPYVEYLAALSYLRTGGYREAERRYDSLLAYPNITAYREVYWHALTDRAELAQRAGDPPAAIRLLQQAIDVIEEIRGSVGAEAARIAIVGDKDVPYRRLVDLLVRRGDSQAAIIVAGRAHSRALVELLAGREHFGPRNATQDRQIAELDRASSDLVLPSAQPQTAQLRLARVQTARRRIQTDAPDVGDLVSVKPAEIETLQQKLDDSQAVLFFYPGDQTWFAFAVTRTRVSVVTAPADQVEPPAVLLRAVLEPKQPGLRRPDLGDWHVPAKTLYQALIAPVLKGLNVRSLIIVPSGKLNYIPFAALGDGSAMVIDHYDVRLLPSLDLLQHPATVHPGKHALVIGDTLDSDATMQLPFAQKEARAVAADFPGATLVIGKDASVARFKREAGSFDMLHFAGHGEFDPVHPLESGLLFNDGRGRADTLRVRDLYDMQMPANLAFLSACQTGLNQVSNGDDLIGLQRGFFFAGVPAVISSLWAVNDETTSELAQSFYRNWKAGASLAESLRQAQLTLRREDPNPTVWAGFVLASVGND